MPTINRRLFDNSLLAIIVVAAALSFSSPTYARGPGGNHGGGNFDQGHQMNNQDTYGQGYQRNDRDNYGQGYQRSDRDNYGQGYQRNDRDNYGSAPSQFPGRGENQGMFPGGGDTQGVFPSHGGHGR
ncbi:MAG TPA: hypothetical protein VIF10_17145 [Methylobacter sp.]